MSKPDDTCMRAFRNSDVVQVRRLIHLTVDACYSGVYPHRAVVFFKDFHSDEKILERHEAGEILVIEQAGKIVATGAIVAGDIFGVFVHPEFQHQGHGGTLMRALEARAKSKGYDEAVLSVSLPSREFYEALGYGTFEDRSIDVGDGERLEFWAARKSLTE
jgi:ribosomal protein S18 acetylase RimI-like enzyme